MSHSSTRWTLRPSIALPLAVMVALSGWPGAADAAPPRAGYSSITGTVTDGSGHGWPLYARIVVDGVARASFTNALTGRFTLTLPSNVSYRLRISPVYSGYTHPQLVVALGSTGAAVAVSVPVDATTCAAPGYAAQRGATVGAGGCARVPGALLLGLTTDANTHSPVNGVTVASTARPQTGATSVTTPDDPSLPDGFYWLFSAGTGPQPFTARQPAYTVATRTAYLVLDRIAVAAFELRGGRIVVSPAGLDETVDWSGAATRTLTVRNTGSAPATVHLRTQLAAAEPVALLGQPVRRVEGSFSLGSMAAAGRLGAPGPGPVATAPWTSVADYPLAIQDNVAAVDHNLLYSGFGFTGGGDTANLYRYDPGTGAWTTLAPAADARERPAAGFIDGKLYAVGGWDRNGQPDPRLEVYDPTSNAWTVAAANPRPRAASGFAVLAGRLYVVGGCSAGTCDGTDVEVYDPVDDAWTAAAAYPEPTAWLACGAIGDSLYCAGGYAGSASTRHTYRYDPAADRWSARADMPMELFSSASTAANGRLLLSGGVSGGALTNQGLAYDPAQDTWSALPNSNQATYRSAGACGFYQIGGGRGPLGQSATVQVLGGLTDCAENGATPWLSVDAATVTVPAQGTTTVHVGLDAGATSVTKPGRYRARLVLDTDTPYAVAPFDVTMTVRAPGSCGPVTAGAVPRRAAAAGAGPGRGAATSWPDRAGA